MYIPMRNYSTLIAGTKKKKFRKHLFFKSLHSWRKDGIPTIDKCVITSLTSRYMLQAATA
jgi:hypothetical protein